MMRRRLQAILVLGALCAGEAHADEAALVAAGREISLQHCGRCHVIDPAHGIGGIGSTPSFKLLMSLADGEQRFVTFFDRRPHGGFIRMEGVERLTPLPPSAAEIHLTADDLDAIVAFALSLK
ncbi:cytochrome c [Nisaea acidiphila]|uniref:Cytochrome c n=1 Tax=Nisaea acidiphila TaxID=1862145 RepID=A0A9J7AW49_9PROT|nr:cytochrome c [Nisaea acidiphila]UUX52019.1 cytochrome c [Nisaea acidiphila]